MLTLLLMLPQAASGPSAGMAPALRNTIVSAYPDDRTARLWPEPGGTYHGQDRTRRRVLSILGHRAPPPAPVDPIRRPDHARRRRRSLDRQSRNRRDGHGAVGGRALAAISPAALLFLKAGLLPGCRKSRIPDRDRNPRARVELYTPCVVSSARRGTKFHDQP